MTAAMIEQVRAVVTTVGPGGAATFASAGELTAAAAGRGTRAGQWPVWGTADGTAVVGEPLPAVHDPYFPGEGGTRFFVVRLPPGLSGGFHSTDTIDYGVVIEGEIVLDLGDGGRQVLPAGTCVVQRGTRHAWRNETGRPALVAFVVVGARRAVP
jgi:quercetin dioxygenase-like cupin family protein